MKAVDWVILQMINYLWFQKFNYCLNPEIPDLMCPKNLEYLRTWNGELRFIQNINLKRFKKKDSLKVSVANIPDENQEEDSDKDMEDAQFEYIW